MPNPLPVPSNGALRTLRTLALGTSCTVAFGAGVLTEDRSRRILAAREVDNNAQRLKAAKNYRSANSSAITDTFGRQIARFGKDEFFPGEMNRTDILQLDQRETAGKLHRPSNRQDIVGYKGEELFEEDGQHGEGFLQSNVENISSKSLKSATRQDPARCRGSEDTLVGRRSKFQPRHDSLPLHLQPPLSAKPEKLTRHSRRRVLSKQWRNAYDVVSLLHDRPKLNRVSPSSFQGSELKTPKLKLVDRQRRLASDVLSLLNYGKDTHYIDAATARFLDAFEEGLEEAHAGIDAQLLDVAVRLSQENWSQSNFDICEKILVTILRYGPIHETTFMLFRPFEIIEALLQGPLDNDNLVKVDSAKLKRATAIFLTRFNTTPGILSDYGMELGIRLCADTCRAGMAELTDRLYWRVAATRGDSCEHLKAVRYLITAQHQLGQHKKVIKYFLRFFTQSKPEQKELYIAGNLAIDSAITMRCLNKAEQVLISASNMAKTENLVASTSWILKVLGSDWRTTRDISRTRSLFDRHEHLIRLTAHPQAVYSAIIQFLVEAGNEEEAISYYAKFEQSYSPKIPDLRTCGHFALAKAMRQDWDGVKNDLQKIATFASRDDDKVYGAIFVPILMAFIKTHSIQETEDFLRICIEKYKLPLTIFISNAMVDAYAKSREIDSVCRWLQYAASALPSVDAVTFNIILNNCHKTWGFSFDESYRLFQSVRDIRGPRGETSVDDVTVSILRDIALAESNGSTNGDISRKLKLLGGTAPNAPRYAIDSRGIQQLMRTAISTGSPEQALRIYKRAAHENIPMGSEVLVTAVKASLKVHGRNLIPTAELLQNPQLNHRQIAPALALVFIFQMSERANDPGIEKMDIMHLLSNMASTLKDQKLIVPAAATHAAHILVNRGLHKQAIHLWTLMSRRQAMPQNSINLVTLTVLLRAYIGLRDSTGVRWVVKILYANNLTPDMKFKRLLKNSCVELRKCLESRTGIMEVESIWQKGLLRFYETLTVALESVQAIKTFKKDEREDISIKTIKLIEESIGREVRERSLESFSLNGDDPSSQSESEVSSSSTHPINGLMN